MTPPTLAIPDLSPLPELTIAERMDTTALHFDESIRGLHLCDVSVVRLEDRVVVLSIPPGLAQQCGFELVPVPEHLLFSIGVRPDLPPELPSGSSEDSFNGTSGAGLGFANGMSPTADTVAGSLGGAGGSFADLGGGPNGAPTDDQAPDTAKILPDINRDAGEPSGASGDQVDAQRLPLVDAYADTAATDYSAIYANLSAAPTQIESVSGTIDPEDLNKSKQASNYIGPAPLAAQDKIDNVELKNAKPASRVFGKFARPSSDLASAPVQLLVEPTLNIDHASLEIDDSMPELAQEDELGDSVRPFALPNAVKIDAGTVDQPSWPDVERRLRDRSDTSLFDRSQTEAEVDEPDLEGQFQAVVAAHEVGPELPTLDVYGRQHLAGLALEAPAQGSNTANSVSEFPNLTAADAVVQKFSELLAQEGRHVSEFDLLSDHLDPILPAGEFHDLESLSAHSVHLSPFGTMSSPSPSHGSATVGSAAELEEFEIKPFAPFGFAMFGTDQPSEQVIAPAADAASVLVTTPIWSDELAGRESIYPFGDHLGKFGTAQHVHVDPTRQLPAELSNAVSFVADADEHRSSQHVNTEPLPVAAIRSEMAELTGLAEHVRISLGDFELESGEIAVIYGTEASGKSLVAALLAGFHRCTTGSVTRFDSTSDLNSVKIRQAASIGFCDSDPTFVPDLSVVENLEIPLLVLGDPPEQARSFVTSALEDFELAHFGDRLGSQLSRTQRVRLGIVRAMLSCPVVILDDVTLGMARHHRSLVLSWIAKAAEAGVAVALVTGDQEISESEELSHLSSSYTLANGALIPH